MEVRVKDSLKKTFVRSRLKWTGHVDRIGEENIETTQMYRKWREIEAMKTEVAKGGLR